MNRNQTLDQIEKRGKPWDFIVIGGGATGIGCALDAASRGFDVLLLEQNDFGKGTSSRSTKLLHGGVRYLAQGNLSLVREALKERGILLKNASHLVEKLGFVVPCFSIWEKFYYGLGLKIYDLLSGKYSFGRSKLLSKGETLSRLPNLDARRLRGGVLYFDGQFDDTRLLVEIAKTAAENSAALLNYASVKNLIKTKDKKICGVEFVDIDSKQSYSVHSKMVINATGVFCDSIRKISDHNSSALITPSQGIHLVFDQSFLGGTDALMIPKTIDGRVLFAIPFHGKTLLGTTDTPIDQVDLEPKPFESEVEFILETANQVLAIPVERKDVLSIFAGIRPLVKTGNSKNTANLSRGHTIEIDRSNLITITGGKWTTYRRMAEDTIDQGIELAQLEHRQSNTKSLPISDKRTSDLREIVAKTPSLGAKIHPSFDWILAEVVYAARHEMALTIEDVLARRVRILFLDANAAIESAEPVAKILARELSKDSHWIKEQIADFNDLAKHYQILD